jgi:3-oxoacyl-[acyl-carrier-protein] synthase-3
MEPKDVDWWIFHQANIRIIEGVLRRMKLDPAKSIVNLDRYGNTSAASIFLALHEGLQKGMLKKGDRVVMTSFGSGMTYGAIMLRI